MCGALQRPAEAERLFAVVQVPAVLPRLVSLPAEKRTCVTHRWRQSFACICLRLFPGMNLESTTVFRVTRNSDFEIDDDEVEDLLQTIEEESSKTRQGAAVRLELESDAPADVEQL